MIKTGLTAPDFTLKDHEEGVLKLSAFKGKKVLLSFHPLAWTGICAEQMKSLETNGEELEKNNTVALGISVDSVPCKAAWAKELGIKNTRLLADFWPHGGVAAAYGIFRDQNGISERANIIIDENGTIIFGKIYPISELPDMEEILNLLRQQ